jgi:hypothetical protein
MAGQPDDLDARESRFLHRRHRRERRVIGEFGEQLGRAREELFERRERAAEVPLDLTALLRAGGDLLRE